MMPFGSPKLKQGGRKPRRAGKRKGKKAPAFGAMMSKMASGMGM